MPTNREDLISFVRNIKPIIEKCQNRQRLTADEQQSVVSFYLEVVELLIQDGISDIDKAKP